MTLEQKAVLLHDAVDTLVVWGLTPLCQGSAAQDRVHSAVAIARQIGDDSLDLRQKLVSWGRWTPNPLARAILHLLDKVGAGDAYHVGHGLHREPL